MLDILQRVITNTPLTDQEQVAVMCTILLLIVAYFVVKAVPVKRVNPWTVQNVRNRNRKAAKKAVKDEKRSKDGPPRS